MTVREILEEFLVNHRLWPEEASLVFDRTQWNFCGAGVKWSDSSEAYPIQVYIILQMCVRRAAIDYLREEKPEHFALKLLEG